MEGSGGLETRRGALVADHVQRDSARDLDACADGVDGLLHLAIATVAPLDGIRVGGQERVVQEGQGLLQGGAEEFLQGLADRLETPGTATKSGELRHSGGRPAAAVEEAVDLVHDLSQRPQMRQPSGYPEQGLVLGEGQAVLDEEVPVVEEVSHPLFEALLRPDGALGFLGRGPALGQFGYPGLQLLTHPGHGTKHGLRQLGQDVEFADLVGHPGEDLGQGRRVEIGAVGGDPLERQPSSGQFLSEASQEVLDVVLGRVVVQDLVDQPLESPVVDDGQDAEGAIVEFVGGDVAGEALKRPVEIGVLEMGLSSFFPPLPPSSGPWRRAQTPGGLARGARMRSGRAIRPPPPAAQPGRRPGACSGSPARPGRPSRC